MNCKQGTASPYVLASKPSSSFSTVSSAASATSAATSRSGGSKLLFGEIDTSSDRSSESYASVCSFVLCDSSTFLKFWLEDKCRDTFLSFVDKSDLASLRLACHDFSVRAAPALFEDLSITFKTNTFTKPSRLAALDRLGFYVKKLRLEFPHTNESYLPPLVDPETGEELSFTYTPQVRSGSTRPKYGDEGTTEILTRQYPPLFHAATNVPAFIRAISAFVNLEHLAVACPGYDPKRRYRRSIVDYALISLRIAVERNCLNALDTLALSPIHPGGLMYLSPMLGFGASPRSASRWSRIRTLTVHTNTLPSLPGDLHEPDQVKLLRTYLCNYQLNLTSFDFRWLGEKGPLPILSAGNVMSSTTSPPRLFGEHPAVPPSPPPRTRSRSQHLRFPKLTHFFVENISTPASEIAAFVAAHRRTVEEINLEDVKLTEGTWDEALAPLTKMSRRHRKPRPEVAEIPIMLGAATFPVPMERIEIDVEGGKGRKSVRMSKWLPTKTRKVREGLLGCEASLKKVLRGSAFPWR